ncbi:protein spitz-like [Panonychus citri]|uniref:protein spitz-like n=1 Tax=Panonychus citri TaxID=50023 RepID=UPI0023074E6B|nr:protein spitz-like [Panonychus citri]
MCKMLPFFFLQLLLRFTESCSSRSTPKPRIPTSFNSLTPSTTRPNITYQTYACPEAYAKWYCLNGATCFSIRVGESILYSCECAHGYMGQRCEFKDLDGSYLPSPSASTSRNDKVTIGMANVAGFFTLTVILVIYVYIAWTHFNSRRSSSSTIHRRHQQHQLPTLTT